MTVDRLHIWQTLFHRAIAILDSACAAGMPDDWSFGGGTVLMLDYHHRFSKDVDIFVPDPQYLGFLTPRLNDRAEVGTHGYDEQSNALKIYYAEGEVDFVAAGPVSASSYAMRDILGRRIRVETPLEIVAKKIKFRAADFKARDLFDLAMVLDRVADTRPALVALIQRQQSLLRERFVSRDTELREDFAAIDVLDYTPSFDACLQCVEDTAGIRLR
jgi:hypothetical protein